MKKTFAVGIVIAWMAVMPLHAQTPVQTTITITCPETGPAIAVCAGIIVLMEELTKASNGQDAFGPNGEVMKLLKAPIDMTTSNIEGAKKESGELAKAIRISTGISIADIEKRGLLGGDNSEARKICNAIANVGGGKC